MYKIRSEKRVLKAISSYPPKHQRQISGKLLDLVTNPFPNDSKKIKGYINYHRIDCGEYRIIYHFDEQTITLILLGKRNDDEVFRNLKKIT